MKKQLRSWKNAWKIIKCKNKGILTLAWKEGLLFEKSGKCVKFKEMYKKNGVSKTCKSVRKAFKTQIYNEFN